jgi:hypothetical protein
MVTNCDCDCAILYPCDHGRKGQYPFSDRTTYGGHQLYSREFVSLFSGKELQMVPRGVTRRLHVLLGVVCRIVDCSTTSQRFLMMELNGRYHLIGTEPFTSCCGKKGKFFELIGQHPRCSELLQTVLDSRSTLDFLFNFYCRYTSDDS